MPYFLGHFADVDLGIEVCREGMAVGTGVAVQYVQILYLIEEMLLSIGGKDIRHTRVES